MRLVRYEAVGGAVRCGVVMGAEIRDLGAALLEAGAAADDMNALLARGMETVRRWAETAPSAGPMVGRRLLAPVGAPGKILALAGNFYVEGHDRTIDTDAVPPWIFLKPATSVAGPEDVIPMYPFAATMIEEIELGVVIGKEGRDIAKDDAMSYVGGYTIVNDISARSLAMPAERRVKDRDFWFDWLNGKWFDGFCSMGPYLVTPDEVKDPHNLKIATRVSGATRFSVSTELMVHYIPETIAFISQITTLQPGDIIAMGVYHGGGDEIYLNSGDVVEGEIEGLGVLRNRFVRG